MRRINKKGISPLISTVLIIGFAVVLAALIMGWGTDFVKDMMGRTGETIDEKLVCTTEVDYDITNACFEDASTLTVTVRNDGKRQIEGFQARLYWSPSDVNATAVTTTIEPTGGIEAVSVPTDLADQVKMVELFPTVHVKGQSIKCSDSKETFGDVDGGVFLSCS